MATLQTYLQPIKSGVHLAQTLFAVVGGCLALAVLTKDGGISGATAFLFALCLLTIPALMYQVMVPKWTYTKRFANIYAHAALDLFFDILWLAAFIAVAVWNSAGIREGEKNDKNGSSSGPSCLHFAYGSVTRCEVSKASVGFGVMIWLLFAVTSAISIHWCIEYRQTGIMPNGSTRTSGQAKQPTEDDPSKDPWNASTDELEPTRTSLDEVFGRPSHTYDVEQGMGLLGHSLAESIEHTDTSYRGDTSRPTSPPHPGRPLSYGTSNPTSLSVTAPTYDERSAPSALSPGGYEQSPGARFNYPLGGHYGEMFRLD
ncbi:hypothetical protein LTR29_008146 [Friedmanniomyces endolithicus]|nr:hypothetical protein LTR29_008146 [Friedmanniomyces endolithicus]